MISSLQCFVNYKTFCNHDFLKDSQLITFVSTLPIDPSILECSKSTIKTCDLFPTSSTSTTFFEATKIFLDRRNKENVPILFPAVQDLLVRDESNDSVVKVIQDLFLVRNDWQINLRSVIWEKVNGFTSKDIDTLKGEECSSTMKHNLENFLKVTAAVDGIKWEPIGWEEMTDAWWSHWELDQFFY